MRVAFYARTAIAVPVEKPSSLPGQIAGLKEWAETLDHRVVGVYSEVASGVSEDRPEFNRMMNDALSAEHPFDAIAVISISRFTRDVFVLKHWERKLKKSGVSIVSTTLPVLTDDEIANLHRRFINLVAEFTQKDKRKSVRRR